MPSIKMHTPRVQNPLDRINRATNSQKDIQRPISTKPNDFDVIMEEPPTINIERPISTPQFEQGKGQRLREIQLNQSSAINIVNQNNN